jgi:hypothetical protein
VSERIAAVDAVDVRLPTSREPGGPDVMNPLGDPRHRRHVQWAGGPLPAVTVDRRGNEITVAAAPSRRVDRQLPRHLTRRRSVLSRIAGERDQEQNQREH